jgi:NAD(P)-dependent dehydrogenase (short-subunit alcohol dehydrogenase family)
MDLKNSVAIVTGGAGGLGKSIVKRLLDKGAKVYCFEINKINSEKLKEELGSRDLKIINTDVSKSAMVLSAMKEVLNQENRLDILINNAGIDFTEPVEELSAEKWNKVIGVNLNAAFYLSREAFLVMKQQKRGHIINITSTASRRAWPNASAYHASKWGLHGLSQALLTEGRSYGIKVTEVVAGGMITPFILERFPEVDLNTLQEPDNVAKAVIFALLQSPETTVAQMMILPHLETSWP